MKASEIVQAVLDRMTPENWCAGTQNGPDDSHCALGHIAVVLGYYRVTSGADGAARGWNWSEGWQPLGDEATAVLKAAASAKGWETSLSPSLIIATVNDHQGYDAVRLCFVKALTYLKLVEAKEDANEWQDWPEAEVHQELV